ncbi:hypothetical protein MSP8886_00445 [Marinomonas spartinae]|uniref:EF-hand domain-containing protein n=1 Tax=Marinomonas spartinae TaxID=1792290 RepID=A0A1A8T1U5_9GAMM|nr:hypothetical protein MSP8886_00445 [Marinomonas spartinae]
MALSPFSVLRFIGLVLGALLGANQALAHPHIWVDSQYQITVDSPAIQTFDATWSMDAFTSLSLLQNYDTNGDGKLMGEERKELLNGLRNLKKNDYFVQLKVNQKTVRPKDVEITHFSFKNKLLTVDLKVTLKAPVNLYQSTLSIAFGDSDYYFAMVPLEEGLLRLSGKLAESCTPISHDGKERGIETWVDLTCEPAP